MAEFDFAAEIRKVLREYTTAVQLDVNKAVEKCARGMVKELKATSPKRSGLYGRDWECRFTDYAEGDKQAVVYNEGCYQLTHLLEKGHKKRGGKGAVKAYVHIAPAADKWTEKFEQMCEEACKGK